MTSLDPVPHVAEAADADLLLRARSGDAVAFGELWRRHYRSGVTVARAITDRFEADDLVQESFTRILQSVARGGGPTGSFRAYLFTSIRNTAASWGRARREASLDEIDAVPDPSTDEAAALAALDRSLTHTAFRSLPTRWQEVLWYAEIEQLKPAEIGPLLGLSPGATSQLLFRARAGLREAWVQAHVGSAADRPDCTWTLGRLGPYVRDGLGRREHARVAAHLAHCTRCAIVAAEAQEVSSRLALVLLPLALGATGATAYLASLHSGASTIAAAATPAAVLDGAATLASTAGWGGTASASAVGSVGAAGAAGAVGTAGAIGTAGAVAAGGAFSGAFGVAMAGATVVGSALLGVVIPIVGPVPNALADTSTVASDHTGATPTEVESILIETPDAAERVDVTAPPDPGTPAVDADLGLTTPTPESSASVEAAAAPGRPEGAGAAGGRPEGAGGAGRPSAVPLPQAVGAGSAGSAGVAVEASPGGPGAGRAERAIPGGPQNDPDPGSGPARGSGRADAGDDVDATPAASRTDPADAQARAQEEAQAEAHAQSEAHAQTDDQDQADGQDEAGERRAEGANRLTPPEPDAPASAPPSAEH